MTPSDLTQYLLIVAVVVPGIVYQTVRARYLGEIPQNQDLAAKVLRALSASTMFALVYAVAFSGTVSAASRMNSSELLERFYDHATRVAVWTAMLVFVMPAVAGRLSAAWPTVRFARVSASLWLLDKASPARLTKTRERAVRAKASMGQPAGLQYNATPSAWDWAVAHGAHTDGFVRVMDADGQWWGGAFGSSSYFSDYPQEPAVYVETTWTMSDTGEFKAKHPGSRGAWIPCKDARVVQFLSAD